MHKSEIQAMFGVIDFTHGLTSLIHTTNYFQINETTKLSDRRFIPVASMLRHVMYVLVKQCIDILWEEVH